MKYIILFTTFIYTLNSSAATMYSYYLSEVLSEDFGGQYVPLLKDISSKSNLDLKIYPFRRSIRDFQKSKDSCIFPMDIIAFESKKNDYIHSDSFTHSPVFFYKLKATDLNDNKKDHKVAINESLLRYVKSSIPKEYHINPVNNDEQLIEMLSRKRVDLIVGIDPDFMTTYNKSKYFKKKSYQVEKYGNKIIEIRDMIICKKSQKNQITIDEFNNFITDGYL